MITRRPDWDYSWAVVPVVHGTDDGLIATFLPDVHPVSDGEPIQLDDLTLGPSHLQLWMTAATPRAGRRSVSVVCRGLTSITLGFPVDIRSTDVPIALDLLPLLGWLMSGPDSTGFHRDHWLTSVGAQWLGSAVAALAVALRASARGEQLTPRALHCASVGVLEEVATFVLEDSGIGPFEYALDSALGVGEVADRNPQSALPLLYRRSHV